MTRTRTPRLRPGEKLTPLHPYTWGSLNISLLYEPGLSRGQTRTIDVLVKTEWSEAPLIYVSCLHGRAARQRLLARLIALFPQFAQCLVDHGYGPPGPPEGGDTP